MGLKDVKVGDKLRYLGGDPAGGNYLEQGHIYEVDDIDGDVIVIDTVDNGSWAIGEDYKNADCFELVEEYNEEASDKQDLMLILIANLAQEITQLKRELSKLRDAMQAQAYEDNEQIERILDDIVMLDERTQGVSNEGQKLLSKEVYIYDTE